MITFYAYGHENLLGRHYNTFEFTKDSYITKKGDCIVGVGSDYKLDLLIKFVRTYKNFKMKIIFENYIEEVIGETNPDFSDVNELVVRKSGFISKRTFGINVDRSALDFNRDLIEKLKCGGKIRIEICGAKIKIPIAPSGGVFLMF